MRIDQDLKDLMIIVAMAVLIPMTVKYGIETFTPNPAPINQSQRVFYTKTGLGAALMVAGAKMTPAVMGTGVFFGGLVLLIKGVRCYWPNLDPMSHFLLLLFGLAIVIFIVQRKHGGVSALKKLSGVRGRKK